MIPRFLPSAFLAALVTFGSPSAAKEQTKPAKQTARTWKSIVEYVLKNGGEDSIKSPSARTLGYNSDEVFAKSLGLDQDKSKDGREHNIFVIYEKNETGTLTPKEIVLGSIRVTTVDSKKRVDSYRMRTSLDGVLIRGMHASGVAGHVVQEALPADSKALQAVFKAERQLNLKDLDLATLTQ